MTSHTPLTSRADPQPLLDHIRLKGLDASELRHTAALLHRAGHYQLADLCELEAVCVEVKTAYWRRCLEAEALMREQRS